MFTPDVLTTNAGTSNDATETVLTWTSVTVTGAVTVSGATGSESVHEMVTVKRGWSHHERPPGGASERTPEEGSIAKNPEPNEPDTIP